MEKEEFILLSNLIKSLEEVILKLEEYNNRKDYENFKKTKNLAIQFQKKILDITK